MTRLTLHSGQSPRWSWPLHWLYPLIGVAFSLVTVAALLGFRVFCGGAPWSILRILEELRSQASTYAFLAATMTASFALVGCVLGRMEERLWESSITDFATGLPNRRHFHQRLASELACVSHVPSELALLVIDLDHLKAINDQYGHAVGDQVLRHVAKSLLESCRSRDFVARWGGDEFVLLAPGTTAEQALLLAERVRARVQMPSPSDQAGQSITVSIGISDLTLAGAQDPDALFESADRALYQAKLQGRSRALLAHAEPKRKRKSEPAYEEGANAHP
jgi:diguanylate cyclase (GGDEF)-like protein